MPRCLTTDQIQRLGPQGETGPIGPTGIYSTYTDASPEIIIRDASNQLTLKEVRQNRPPLPPLPPHNIKLYEFIKISSDQQAHALVATYLNLNPYANVIKLYKDCMSIQGLDGCAEFRKILKEDIATIELAQQKEYQRIKQKWDPILNDLAPIKVVAKSRRIATEYWLEHSKNVNDNLFDLSTKTTLQDLI